MAYLQERGNSHFSLPSEARPTSNADVSATTYEETQAETRKKASVGGRRWRLSKGLHITGKNDAKACQEDKIFAKSHQAAGWKVNKW